MEYFDLVTEIDDDSFQKVAQLEGQPIRVEQWNHEASWDVVRHYSLGLGDDNPLFCDLEYGESTPYGTLIAPPTFLYTAFDGAIGMGLPGVQPIYAGTDWRFYRRIHQGERIVASATFGPVRRVSGSVAPDMVIQSALCEYRTRDGELLAEATASTFRIPRRAARQGLAYREREEHRYTEEELASIVSEVLREYRRGSGSLSDVKVGDRLTPVVKGPINRIDMTAYYAGCPGSPGYKSCEMAWKYRYWAEADPSRLPSNYDTSYFAERVLPSIGHQDASAARELGMPNAYNNGPQRVGWFAHCVTNWMGDGAFLRKLNVQLRRPEVFGDTIRIGGRVAEVQDDSRPWARLDLWAENQLGERTASGEAEVVMDDYGRRPG